MQLNHIKAGKLKIKFRIKFLSSLFCCFCCIIVFSLFFYSNFVQSEDTGAGVANPPHRLKNFTEAKHLALALFAEHPFTFYCGCRFNDDKEIDLSTCSYQMQGDEDRATRLEWEHVVPVSLVAQHLPCWQKKLCCNKQGVCYKGRRCCRQDPWFNMMEADLHNIVPEIGELNKIRSNYRFGVLPHIPKGQLGACDFKVDRELRRVEPNDKLKGTIARAYLYMTDTYHVRLSDSQRQLFEAWNKEYPPDAKEIDWDNDIQTIQGNHNLYISEYEDHLK